MHHQSVKTVSKVNFSIIHLVTVSELTSLIIQTHYTWTTLCLHLQKSLTIKHFLQKQCNVRAAFADVDVSFPERLLSGWSISLVSCILPLRWFHAATYHQQL